MERERFPPLPHPCHYLYRLPENKIPILEYRPDPRLPLTVLLCIAITIWWLIERHSIYGWILQDILGIYIPLYDVIIMMS